MKVRRDFKGELEETVVSGCADRNLHGILLSACYHLDPTTQKIEGANNVIGDETRKNPAIKFQTVSDRLGLIKNGGRPNEL